MSADNCKPQAGGHVTSRCRRSIRGRNDLLLSFTTGVPSLPLPALFFIFFARHLSRCALLTERLEEAIEGGGGFAAIVGATRRGSLSFSDTLRATRSLSSTLARNILAVSNGM